MSGSRSSFARAFFVSALVVSCTRSEARVVVEAGAPPAVTASAATAAAAATIAPPEVHAPSDAATGLREPPAPGYMTAAPVAGKSIGHTSVVFKLKLEGGLDAAYKPRSKRGNGRYKGEVAAYRLATALGIPNVPPALARTFDFEALRRALGQEPIFGEEVVADPAGQVRGAVIPWIKKLDFLPLERDPSWSEWQAWLTSGGALPDDKRAFASQVSTMVVFDYVTGNWDRWSGGNIGFDAATQTLLFIDNDGAFFDPPPAPQTAKQLGLVEHVDRFSRAFVVALRAVDLSSAIGEEVPGEPLLSKHALQLADDRRRRALKVIDAKIERTGEAKTLAFD
jgi:hypothetical protein